MIIIPTASGLSSRLQPSSDQNLDEQSEDDIHICGSCKKQFNDIFLFMRHKSENNCRSKHSKKSSDADASSTCTVGESEIFPSIGGSSLRSTRPETKYTRVALVNTEAFTIQKEDVFKKSPTPAEAEEPNVGTHPPHLLLADLASQRLDLLNQDENSADKAGESDITLEDDWDSSWSAAKVLGTFSVSNSLRRLQNQNLSSVKENSDHAKTITAGEENVPEQSEHQVINQDRLQSCEESAVLSISHDKQIDSQIHTVEDCPVQERFIGPHGGLLDVEDVEVATLLANHLTNEPKSFLTYSNLQNQLVIQDNTETLSFENDGEREESIDKPSIIDQGTVDKTSEESNNNALRKNVKSVRKRKLHSCPNDGCNFQGTSVRDLTRHIRKHTGERPFKCTECEKTFTRRDKLSSHLRYHAGVEKTFQCNVCEFACSEQNSLVIHMRRHTDERPYECQICGHKARTKSHLIVHLRKHTGDHPYKCKKCGRAFTTSSDLTRHSRLHTGDKPFACEHCSYAAALKTSLKTHIQQNHSPGVSLTCPKCSTQCQSRKDLRIHIKAHKDDSKHCSKCDFIGSTNTALKKHFNLHTPEKLKQSPLLNGKRGTLKGHQKKKCSSKKQKKPLEVFSDVYSCTYCTESFWREDALEEHIRQHQLDELVGARAPDPVLADSADSRDSNDSTSMDVTCGLAGLAALASYHSASEQTSSEQQPTFLYRYISGSQSSESNDNLRNAEILASLNQGSGALPQYVAIQGEQNTLVDALNCIQYVLPSPLGTLDDNENDNATSLLC
ncbi:Zinc finger protein 64 [Frankliniella fusca]|uniref:Zinc finger protein 64 n=1 Tax=Frankliniella fusca TaxID=407009 RepID=A0AAE1L9X5_9NEOP|nr:Zinc finger protein 64 [Frankliniella fusca]